MDQSEESQQQQQQEQQERVLENGGEVTYSLPQFNHGPGVETGMPAVPVSSPTQQPPGSTSQQEQLQQQQEQLQQQQEQQQLPYPQLQQFYQQQQGQQQNQLQEFWDYQMQEVEEMTDFRNHSLPLARIKKIMKADEDVRMISSEAPVLFAKACEMFILELTFRSWLHTEENKRRTLQKNDIAAAISRTDLFDFLVDIIPRDEIKEEALSVARANIPLMGAPGDVPYYYVPQQHAMGQGGLYPDQQPHPALPYMPWQQPQQNQQPQQYEDQPQQNGN